MFTDGDKRWIQNWKPKGVKMKPTKKRPAKRTVAHTENPIVGKLLRLKYRINDTAKLEDGWSDDMSSDKKYVMSLLTDIRKHNFKKLAPEDVHCCNGLWRKYA
tara:strand:- start:361 stop:669 length:309 start_codon:yes stop_codon:yes gene_type:complete